jgi:16S rRNA (uracil1498-N3)-methyltransferase
VVEIDEATRRDPLPFPAVNVTMAPPKGERLTWAVQKLAELGVHELNLIPTERTVRHPSPGAMARLRTVSREAAMQSRHPTIMEVGERSGLREALLPIGGVSVMLHEGAARSLSEVLPAEVNGIHLLIGPEGGFSDREIRQADEAGADLASLGSSILRTETAAVVGAALVLHRYGGLG